MRRIARTLLGTMALGAAVAVAPLGAAVADAVSDLTFSSTQSQSEQTPQTATGAEGSIEFTGSLTTPTPCWDVAASHRVRGNRVTVTVDASQRGDICTQVITHNNYTGAVTGLAAGSYTFEVIHGSGRNAETAWSGTVVVQ